MNILSSSSQDRLAVLTFCRCAARVRLVPGKQSRGRRVRDAIGWAIGHRFATQRFSAASPAGLLRRAAIAIGLLLSFVFTASNAQAGTTTTKVQIKGFVSPVIHGLNDLGDASGEVNNRKSGLFYGFVRYADGATTPFQISDEAGNEDTYAFGIDQMEDVVGYYSTLVDGCVGFVGFFRSGAGGVSTISAPGACWTWPEFISPQGFFITGTYRTPGFDGIHGFAATADVVTGTFDPPGSVDTEPTGINSSGVIVGYFVTETGGPKHGFIRQESGAISQFDVPGSFSTTINGISDSGWFVGSYATNISGNSLSFYSNGTTTILFDPPKDTGGGEALAINPGDVQGPMLVGGACGCGADGEGLIYILNTSPPKEKWKYEKWSGDPPFINDYDVVASGNLIVAPK